jgi:xylulokinase
MIVGVDIGTQSLKVVVTDGALRPLGRAARAYAPSFPRPGWAEQDPLLWEKALAPAITEALAAADVAAGEVRALGLAGQLDGCVAVDEAGRPLAPCLIWMDRRATAQCEGIPAELVRERAGVVLDASHMAAKIRWLETHLAPVRPACYHQPVSYMVERLTGRRVLDHGLASTTMLYGLGARTLDPELLRLFAIRPESLPAIADAACPAGPLTRKGVALTGLPEGTPVAVGTGDDFAMPLGAGIAAPGRLLVGLGTAEVVGALHPEPLIDARGLVETHAFPGGLYFIENPGWLSGGAVAWLCWMLGVASPAELDRLAEAVPPGAEGVTFLPALAGAMAPEWRAEARGCFYGLTPAHGQGHLARALLEGCAFAMYDVLRRLQEMGLAIEALRLVGGAARSRVWARIRADLAGLPVERAKETDASPLGAALLAAVAAGIERDIAKASARLGGIAERIQPDSATRPAYLQAHERYLHLFDSLRPVFGKPA